MDSVVEAGMALTAAECGGREVDCSCLAGGGEPHALAPGHKLGRRDCYATCKFPTCVEAVGPAKCLSLKVF